jgi:hypothetical protein
VRPDAAIQRLRQRATSVEEARVRLAGAMRTIRDLAGIDAVRAVMAAELARLERPGDRDWIG